MFENENTAQTNDTEVSTAATDAGGGEVAEESRADFTDTQAEDADAGDSGKSAESADGTSDKERQRAINAENARRRRELDAAKNEARNKAILDVLGGVNPYTQEPMKDTRDVEEYLTMKEIEKAGKDPVADYSRYQKQRERERDAAIAAEESQKEWYRNDQAEFAKAHPDVNVSELIKNKAFL